jgi:hypothetical protein
MLTDSDSPLVHKTLEETVSWCSRQPLLAEAEETKELLRRRRLVQDAAKLLQRHAYETPGWLRAFEMLKEAQPDSLAPLENQLRSSVLKPSIPIGDICSKPEMINAIVAEVVKKRSQFLAIDPSDHTDYQSLKSEGRLLVYEPSENVSDGASRYASQGFYDPSDAPPWDSWVHYSDGSLICWVPAVLIPLCQSGIDANPVDCIRWAGAEDIRRLGLQ